MKKRRVLGIEQLEARETPDVSIGSAAACSVPAAPTDPTVSSESLLSDSITPGSDHQYTFDQTSSDVVFTSDVGDGTLSTAGSYLQALERLFNEGAFQQFLDRGADALSPEASPAVQHSRDIGRSADAAFPANGVPKQSATALHDQEVRAWQFLYNYTRKAIRNEEMKYGGLSDHEDIIHQTFVEWREQVGRQEAPLSNLLNKDSAERQVLQKTVRRVIDHTRYEQNRQKRTLELFDQPAPPNPEEKDWIDLQLDMALGAGNLVPQEMRLLELRRQGMTFEEIGSEIGMVKQRVYEIYSSTLDRLQKIYAS
ncbi:MAG TPA: hypothetical protein VK395_06510 [Gemmataceae bacterium]|nr:hypothetical protein [Gemmataceae bacterium]